MKKLLLLITLVAGIIAFALPAQANTLTFFLDTSLPEDLDSDPWTYKPDPDGAAPWLKAVFNDGGLKSVYLTLTANLGVGPDPEEDLNKVGVWYFNLDPELDATQLEFSVVGSHTAPAAKTIKTGSSDLKANGDGYFDIEFGFPPSASNPFDNSDEITYLITSTQEIFAESFNFESVTKKGGSDSGENSWFTAAHIQSISELDASGDNSTWIGGEGGLEEEGDPIPEPATLLLLGSGLIGIAVSGKKKFKKRNG